MQSKKNLYVATIFGSLATLAGATPAFAQSAASEDRAGVDEIFVTARRTEENLQTTPVAVTAVTAAELERGQIDSLQELMYAAPNLAVTSGGPGDAALLQAGIRGQVQLDGTGAIDQPIGLYVDGIYIGRASGALLDLVDARQVEVLRGPQGTLFGRNTTGGAISITTQAPTGDFGGMLRASGGNFGTQDFTAVVNVPIFGDQLAGRVIYRHSEHEGYGRNNFLNADIGADDLDFYRFVLRAAPTGASWDLTLTGDRTERQGDGQMHVLTAFLGTPVITSLLGFAGLGGATLDDGGLSGRGLTTRFGPGNAPLNTNPCALPNCTLPAPAVTLADFLHGTGDWHSNNANNQPFDELTTEGLSATYNLDLGVLNFKSITGYRTLDARGLNDTDGTPWTILNTLYDNRQNQFSQELQLFGDAGAIDWIVGAFYFEEQGHETTTSENWSRITGNTNALPVAPTFRPTFNDAHLANQSSAIYGQLNIEMTERLRGTIGLRQTWDSREVVLHNLSLATAPPLGANCVVLDRDPVGAADAGVCNQTLNVDFDYLSYLVGLDYQATDNVFFYVKHSRAFRSGGFNTRNGTPLASIPYQPEEVQDIEGGVKADWFDNRLRTNLALFYAEYTNMQRPGVAVASVLSPAQYLINAGESHVSGLELELVAAPTETLELTASVGLTNPGYDQFSDTRLGDRSSEDFPQTPELTFSVGATQHIPVSFGQFVLHVDYAYVGDQNFTPSLAGENAINPGFPVSLANAGVVEAYGLFNGQISLELDNPGIEISLWGRNLADEEYYVRKYADLLNLFGFSSGNVGDPLTYGVTVTYRFGE